MRHVVFVAPFLMDATRRFVEAVAGLEDVRLSLLTQEPVERVPPGLRSRLAQHWRVDDALDPTAVVEATRQVQQRVGPVTRLLGTLEQLQVPLARARAALGIEGLGVEAALAFRDKAHMKDMLRAAGVPCARHGLAASAADALGIARRVGYPLVVKPPAGAGAKATFRVDGPAALERALEAVVPAPGREVLLEEFVQGQEHSFDTVSIRGRPIWHSLSHYFPSPLTVLENPWIQWVVVVPREVDHARYDDIRQVAFRTLEVLGMETGVTHLEWFRRPDGSIAISEVAARPPGAQFCSLISYANDFDFYRAWAGVVVWDRFVAPARRYAAGGAYLRGQGSGRVRRIHGLDQAQQELGRLVVEAHLPHEGTTPSGSYEGEGYVILRHPDTSVVEQALKRLVSLVRVELA